MNPSRPRTAEELAALPVGPAFAFRTDEIEGKIIRRPIAPDVVAFAIDDGPISWTDAEGAWTLGRYADGSWFKSRR